MKKFRRRLINIIVALLILVGLALIFNRPIRNFILTLNSNRYQVSNFSASDLEKNKQRKVSYDFKAVKPVSFSTVLASQGAQNLPVIGGVTVPEVNINLPIFLGMGNEELSSGAGTMKPDQVMGKNNYALASHHVFAMAGASQLLFSPLEKAKAGMDIYLTDKKDVYDYKIDKVYTVSPDQVAVIDDHQGVNEITLVTCTDLGATGRIIVHGNFIEKYPFEKAPKAAEDGFEMKYNQWKQ